MRVEQIGDDATLYLGDCLEILPTLGPVDAVVTDPPYGSKETHSAHLSSITLRNGEPARQALGFDGFNLEQFINISRCLVDKSRRWVVMSCEWQYIHALPNLIRMGIWRKRDGAPQFTGDRPGTGWEGVAILHRDGKKHWNGGGKHAFWDWPKAQNDSGHPTGKPIGLVSEWVKDFTDAGEVVLDPFMGSGTTGVACANLGRKFIGIEIEPKYFDIACKRIDAAYAQGRLFA